MGGFGIGGFGDVDFGTAPSRDFDYVNLTIRELLRTQLGMPDGTVRPAQQNAPRGVGLTATVNITLMETLGWDSTTYSQEVADGVNLSETISGQRHVVASAQFYGPGANTQVSRIPTVLQSSSAIQLMQSTGVCLSKIGQPRNLTTLIGVGWEDRAQIDLEFHFINDEENTVLSYATFPVTVKQS